jgi:hypothetical protein
MEVIYGCVPLPKLLREEKQQKDILVGPWMGGGGAILLPTFETLRNVPILPGYEGDKKVNGAVFAAHL